MTDQKRRPSLLKKFWTRLRGAKPQPKLAAERPPKRGSSLEPLEGRIAPAALINPTTLVYKDIDGDIVTVKFSKALFNEASAAPDVAALANLVFKFDTGNVLGTGFTAFDPGTAVAQQLQLIDLTKAPASGTSGNLANGIGFTISAVQGSLPGESGDVAGDGFAHIGRVNAVNIGLGKVSIAGDLGQIDAGSAAVKTAVASLTVQSLGAKGLTTQGATGASLESNLVGALGSLTVAGDVKDASIRVVNGIDFLGRLTAPARIGAVNIGGSLIGTAAAETASDNSGLIQSAGDIGAIKIGGDIVGGGGQHSGSFIAGGKIASVLVNGDIVGGAGGGSGVINAGTVLGATKVLGSVIGGGANSGILEGGSVAAVTIGGDVVAGTGASSGLISSLSTMGAVKIGGDIDGSTTNAGAGSGGVISFSKIASVTVSGALLGGSGAQSGFIASSFDIGAVKLQSVAGGDGQNSGTVIAGGKIASLTVAQDIVGGAGAGSGSVFGGFDVGLAGDIGAVKVAGKLEGGAGASSGTIHSTGKIKSVTIGPAKAVDQALLQGGDGDFSGAIWGRGVGAVKIGGHVEGGAGEFSGAIVSQDFLTTVTERAGDLAAVTIGGSLKGGTGDNSGVISADGKLAKATVGDLLGGDGERSGAILAGQGLLAPGNTGAIAIKGALVGGAGDQSGGVVAEGKITTVTVTGNAIGGTIRAGDNLAAIVFKGNVDGTLVTARGQAEQSASADVAIGKITVSGNVSNARFAAGYDTALVASNTDAQIGAVKVAGNWAASDLVAGVLDGGDAGFGTAGDVAIGGADNAKIVSSIASIVIGGTVSGTPLIDGDHYGFTAQKIGSFKAGGVAQLLNKLADGQVIELPSGDVTIREVGVPPISEDGLSAPGSGNPVLSAPAPAHT